MSFGCGGFGRLGHGDRKSHFYPVKIEMAHSWEEEETSRGSEARPNTAASVAPVGPGGSGIGMTRDSRPSSAASTRPTTSVSLGSGSPTRPEQARSESKTRSATSTSTVALASAALSSLSLEKDELPVTEERRDRKFSAVACGGLHTAALTANGDVWMWGMGKVSVGWVGFRVQGSWLFSTPKELF